jgi:hypothetical protein
VSVCFPPVADIRLKCDGAEMQFEARRKKLVRHKPVEKPE